MAKEMIEVSKYDVVSIDCETDGLQFWKHRPFALVYATPDGRADCLDLRDPRVLSWARREIPKIPKVVGHNLKFDAHMLREVGIVIRPDSMLDTMVAAALIDEHLPSYSLDYVAKKYVGQGKEDSTYAKLADLFGGKPTREAQMPNLHRAPWPIIRDYAIPDAVITLKLWMWQREELVRQELGAVWDVEMRLLSVLLDLEKNGVRVDVESAHRAVGDITKIVAEDRRKLDDIAGFPVNPNPSDSIKRLFKPVLQDNRWVLVDGTVADTTEGGEVSINADVLRRMKHPAAALILRLRQMIKTRDTFLSGHILGHHHEGVVHANFNQTKSDNDLGTGTGRLSCNAPALQQIHKRNVDIAAIVRSLFIPDWGQEWHCHDWAQMDFRVFADYVANPSIFRIYKDNPNADFHQVVADMTGLPRSPVTGVKGNAKQINLGLIFGMGEGKLAQEMGLPFTVEQDPKTGKEWVRAGEEAKEVFKKYHAAVPGVKDLLSLASTRAKSRGWVRTILGRRIRFPGGQYTHKAGGLIFQGTAAEALKLKLVQVHEALKGTEARLMLNVHDEFDISAPVGSGDKYGKQIQTIIRDFSSGPIVFTVPIMSDLGIGPNWWIASK